jgi:capsular polysaccharide biosynthesis protein
MELRRYWNIALRRWWLILAITGIAAVLGIFWSVSQPQIYTASARVVISQIPAAPTDAYYNYDHYYNWLSSEYVLDDYTVILKSQVFATDVAKRLSSMQPMPSDGAIAGALSVSRENRIMTIDVSWSTPEGAKSLANAAADTVVENRMKYYGRPGTDDISANVIDYAAGASSSSSKKLFNLALAVVLGLAAGLFLAFMADYLDDSIRDRSDVENYLGLPVVGAIPLQNSGTHPGIRMMNIKLS